MQAYIGCKIILGEKCSKESFDMAKADDFAQGEVDVERKYQCELDQYTEGYHVAYPNPDGSKYHAWSPVDMFERAYRRIQTDEKELISSY